MGKWVTLVLLLVGATGKWVMTEEILGRVHVGEFDVVHWWVVMVLTRWERNFNGFGFPRWRRWEMGHDGEIAPLYTSETWALFTGDDGIDEAREVETFFWVWVSALGEGQGWRGRGNEKKRNTDGDENGTRVTKQKWSDTVIVVGSMNSVKNIEW